MTVATEAGNAEATDLHHVESGAKEVDPVDAVPLLRGNPTARGPNSKEKMREDSGRK